MIRSILAVFALVFATAAHATWYEATSSHFVVYSQGSAQEAQDFAGKLERYRFVLTRIRPIPQGRPEARLRVFLLLDQNAVIRMAGGASVAGYYVDDARALMLVGTRRALSNLTDVRSVSDEGPELDPQDVLFHEYFHHFTFQYFPAAYPVWYSEGSAEFWGTTAILPGDVVEVGRPADYRASTLRGGWLPLERLLTAHNYGELHGGEEVSRLYAEGWLLVRYIFDHPQRQHQIQEYLRLINNGVSFDAAAHQAIPDLDAFNTELYNYAGQNRFNIVRLPFRTIDVGPITVRTLRPAEQALIEDEVRLSQGYSQHEATDFANHIREVASHYPDDPFAIRMVMETQYLAGNTQAALAAADHLLAIEPNNARALATKGLIQVAGLAAAHNVDAAAWRAARQFLIRAVNAAPNDPVVLENYYRSFVMQGVLPPDDAQSALYTAMELAPSDGELRYELARDFENRHMISDAIAIIRPKAYQVPHRGNESEGERRRREQREIRERQAGSTHHENALEMLTRLEAERAQAQPAAAAH